MPPAHTTETATGRVLIITVPAPAAGTVWTVTVPPFTRWHVLVARFLLTDGASFNARFVGVAAVLAGVEIWATHSITSAGNLAVFNYTFAPGLFQATANGAMGHLEAPLPAYALAPPGTVISALADALFATDQFSNIRLIVEAVSDP